MRAKCCKDYLTVVQILIIEDDVDLLQLYQEILTEAGYDVEVAQDGASGWKKAWQGGYDLILLDISMPGTDGLTLLKQLKKTPPDKPNKKILILTAHDVDTYVREALKHGADGYLLKAELTPDKLVERVKEVVGR